jgi:hypothetical protein
MYAAILFMKESRCITVGRMTDLKLEEGMLIMDALEVNATQL